jgi:hypothetical protein
LHQRGILVTVELEQPTTWSGLQHNLELWKRIPRLREQILREYSTAPLYSFAGEAFCMRTAQSTGTPTVRNTWELHDQMRVA